LTDPVVNPLYTKPTRNFSGKTLTCQGYGKYGYGDNDWDGRLRTAELTVRAQKSRYDILEDPNDQILVEAQLMSEQNGRRQVQWQGDSGGPCFYTEDSVQYVVSVNGACDYDLDQNGKVVNVPRCYMVSSEVIADWVYSNVGMGYQWDPDYYYARYPDLMKALGGDYVKGVSHWNNHGKGEGRDSSPSFSVRDYLALNPDVASYYGATNYKNAIKHLYYHGIKEGRRASLAFDVKYYLSKNSDLRSRFGSTDYKTAANHFAVHGLYERRASSPVFDVAWYLDNNADLKKYYGAGAYLDALVHWQAHGLREGRQAHPDFSPRAYLARYSDLRKAFGNDYRAATLHYLVHGINEGRNGRP
jgi:hypothetical protein